MMHARTHTNAHKQALYRIEKVKDSGPVEETFVAHELMGVRCVLLYTRAGLLCVYICMCVRVCVCV